MSDTTGWRKVQIGEWQKEQPKAIGFIGNDHWWCVLNPRDVLVAVTVFESQADLILAALSKAALADQIAEWVRVPPGVAITMLERAHAAGGWDAWLARYDEAGK